MGSEGLEPQLPFSPGVLQSAQILRTSGQVLPFIVNPQPRTHCYETRLLEVTSDLS